MRRHPRAIHALRADDMRRHPRMWIEVAVYNGPSSAESTARQIRTGDRVRHYLPAGAFETRTAPVDTGTALYARYIGGPLT
ncbi:hypothetical protein ACFVRD_34160 [Streptomyces sp. NPDC057908]|uniref:hypothetical protein n=1 Tax=Streptomyces sp. NPDC057908 TaxID=3346276 RepID=UPI0036E93DBF